MATFRRIVFAAAVTVACVSAIAAAALVSLIASRPDQVAVAISEGDVIQLVTLIFDRVASVCVTVFQLL